MPFSKKAPALGGGILAKWLKRLAILAAVVAI
jgi:hypothetical protein